MEGLLDLLILEEVLGAAGSLHQILLRPLLHPSMLLLLFALELLLDVGHHIGQFLHWRVFGLILAPAFGGGRGRGSPG